MAGNHKQVARHQCFDCDQQSVVTTDLVDQQAK